MFSLLGQDQQSRERTTCGLNIEHIVQLRDRLGRVRFCSTMEEIVLFVPSASFRGEIHTLIPTVLRSILEVKEVSTAAD
eukprot:scaffold8739_cov173-Ochromonas_danica.AAC.1